MSQMRLTSSDLSANGPTTKTSTRPPVVLLERGGHRPVGARRVAVELADPRRSHCCVVKWGARVLRARSVSRGEVWASQVLRRIWGVAGLNIWTALSPASFTMPGLRPENLFQRKAAYFSDATPTRARASPVIRMPLGALPRHLASFYWRCCQNMRRTPLIELSTSFMISRKRRPPLRGGGVVRAGDGGGGHARRARGGARRARGDARRRLRDLHDAA